MYITPTVTAARRPRRCGRRRGGPGRSRQAGHLRARLDLALVGAVEHRRRDVDAAAQLVGEATDVVVVELVDEAPGLSVPVS
jgi:hypothetical protein